MLLQPDERFKLLVVHKLRNIQLRLPSTADRNLVDILMWKKGGFLRSECVLVRLL